MAGIKRITSASAMAALSISVSAIGQQAMAQQAPAPDAPKGEEVETVIVTGVREALAKGLENKKAATQVVESIVAEDIGKLPDNNVVEALQRVTGVQVTNRGGGEADGISIRGLPDITTTWNGRNVFTASGRSLALQDIPANLVGRIDVFKTRASEQIETGLAGQIDVRTRRPFDIPGTEFSLNGRLVKQDQRENSLDPNASMLISSQWDTGASKFGALLNVSYSRVRYRDQSVTAGALVPFANETNPPQGYGAAADNCPNTPPGNVNWIPLERIFNTDCRGTLLGANPLPLMWQAGLDRGLSEEPGATLNIAGQNYPYLLARDALFASDFEGDRKRPAANLALQWAPNDSSEYTFEAFYQGYREEMFNNLHFTFADWWGALPANSITMYPDTNLIKTRVVGFPFGFNSGDSTKQSTNSYVYALNGKWEINDKFHLTADLSFQESQFDTSFIAVRTERVPEQIRLDFNAGNGIPSWHFFQGGVNADANMLNPQGWTVGQIFQNAGRNEGDAQTLSVDGDYQFGGVFKTLKFGIRYDERGASASNPRPQPNPFLGGTLINLPIEATWINHGFMDGEADVPTSWAVVNGYWVRRHADEVRDLYGQPHGDPALIKAFDVTEKTSSAYVQADMEFGDKFHAQAGVRYVRVDTPIDFTDVISGVQSSAKKSVSDVLPSATLRYDITNDLRVRFNYGETLRRPDFTALNPNFGLTADLTNVGYGTGAGGNPDLEATKAKNYDLTLEWYFSRDSAIYGTAFRREIDGLVVPLTRRITIPNTGLNTDQFVVTQPVNASDGVLKGIELGFQYFPSNLPGFLDGLGIVGSFTKLDSEQNIPQTDSTGAIIGEETTEFFGVSDTSYNVTLAYDHSGIGARLSYVWRDNFLNNNEARIFANPIGIWRTPERSLDFQVSYDFSENFAVSFDAVNITQELQQSYYKFADAGSPGLTNFGTTLLSRQFALGVRWKY